MIRATVRTPNRRNIPNFNAIIQQATRETGRELNKQFDTTTTTWNHNVRFDTRYQGINKVTVLTKDKPYFFVNDGTRVRRALMSPDFISKSQPRRLPQRAGRGGVVYISRKLNLPGIQAREFDKIIAKEIKPFMVATLIRLLRSV